VRCHTICLSSARRQWVPLLLLLQLLIHLCAHLLNGFAYSFLCITCTMLIIIILRHASIQELHFSRKQSGIDVVHKNNNSCSTFTIAGRCNSSFWCLILFPKYTDKDSSSQKMLILPKFLFDEKSFRSLVRTSAWTTSEDG